MSEQMRPHEQPVPKQQPPAEAKDRATAESETAAEVERMMEEETRLLDAVREKAQAQILKRGWGNVPTWLKRGAIAVGLFSAETALANSAQDTLKYAESEAVAEGNAEYPAIPETAKETLLEFLNSPDASVIVHAARGTVDVEHDEFRITKEAVEKGKPFVFSFPIGSIEFSRSIEKSGIVIPDGEWEHLDTASGDSYQVVAVNNNQFDISRMAFRDDEMASERIYVTPVERAVEDDRTSIPFSVDWQQAGLGDLDGAFYDLPQSVIGTVAGLDVYSAAQNRDRIGRELKRYDQDLSKGIAKAGALFALSESPVTSVKVWEEDYGNAGALGTDLVIFDDLLQPSADAQADNESSLLSHKQMQNVAEHETFHVIDFSIGITTDPILHELFTLSDKETLKAYNESNFPDAYGGHAQENAVELFATLMNGLDDPNWETWVSSLTDAQKEMYRNTLEITKVSLEQNDRIPDSAPVLDLLQERISYLGAP